MSEEQRWQFSTAKNIDAEVKQLYEHAAQLKRGSLILYVEIESLTGIKKDDKQWGRLIRRWKTSMRKNGKPLPEYDRDSKGYKLLSVESQLVSIPERLQRRAERQFKRATQTIVSIHPEEMNESQQVFAVHRVKQLATVKDASSEQRKIASSWLSNPESLPKTPLRKLE